MSHFCVQNGPSYWLKQKSLKCCTGKPIFRDNINVVKMFNREGNLRSLQCFKIFLYHVLNFFRSRRNLELSVDLADNSVRVATVMRGPCTQYPFSDTFLRWIVYRTLLLSYSLHKLFSDFYLQCLFWGKGGVRDTRSCISRDWNMLLTIFPAKKCLIHNFFVR
jgi:hypothetical protein